jgi:hypothetical protein
MQKVTVTYEGVDNSTVEATHYFNLSETDFADIIAEKPDFFKPSRLKDLVDRSAAAETQEEKVAVQAEMAVFIKSVIIHAHGTRVGNEFFHIPEETLKFTRGLACHAVVQKVLESEESLVSFFAKVLPESVRENFTTSAKS